MEQIVGVSHECDFPKAANDRPRITHSPIHRSGLTSNEIDARVRQALRENGTIYTIDEPLLRELRPDIILTQKLCDVCAIGYGTVARLAATLPGPPMVVNLEPSSLADIFANNSLKNGLLTVTLPETKIAEIMGRASQNDNYQLSIDLEKLTVIDGQGLSTPFTMDAFARHCLLNGHDSNSRTAQNQHQPRSSSRSSPGQGFTKLYSL
jgi:hypothetical protein